LNILDRPGDSSEQKEMKIKREETTTRKLIQKSRYETQFDCMAMPTRERKGHHTERRKTQ
jgi:hypothetical protein